MTDDETDSDGGLEAVELLKRGGVALALALVMNWIVLYVVLEFGLAPPFEALEFGSVTLFTVLGVVGAAVVYGALTRLLGHSGRDVRQGGGGGSAAVVPA